MPFLSFHLPANYSPAALAGLEDAYIFGGPDVMPWPTDLAMEGNRLILKAPVEENGGAAIPWRLADERTVVLSTTTLASRKQSYPLLLELARGKVGQVRNQAGEWQATGLGFPPEIENRLKE